MIILHSIFWTALYNICDYPVEQREAHAARDGRATRPPRGTT